MRGTTDQHQLVMGPHPGLVQRGGRVQCAGVAQAGQCQRVVALGELVPLTKLDYCLGRRRRYQLGADNFLAQPMPGQCANLDGERALVMLAVVVIVVFGQMALIGVGSGHSRALRVGGAAARPFTTSSRDGSEVEHPGHLVSSDLGHSQLCGVVAASAWQHKAAPASPGDCRPAGLGRPSTRIPGRRWAGRDGDPAADDYRRGRARNVRRVRQSGLTLRVEDHAQSDGELW